MPHATEDPGAKPLNEATKYVASRSRPTLGWSNSVLIVVLGSGKRLFAEGTVPAGLKLVDSTVSTTGVVIGTYEPAGEIVTGSFALD